MCKESTDTKIQRGEELADKLSQLEEEKNRLAREKEEQAKLASMLKNEKGELLVYQIIAYVFFCTLKNVSNCQI